MKIAKIQEGLRIPEWKARMIQKLTQVHGYNSEHVDTVLALANTLLEGFGVEKIDGPHVDHYYMNINILYVNLGDTYTPTVLYDTLLNRFFICSWGDYIESKPKRFPMSE